MAQQAHEYWRSVLSDVGGSPLPRWPGSAGEPALGELTSEVPGPVAAALGELAGQWSAGLADLLLAVHAKVLAAVTGEGDLLTGRVRSGWVLPVRVAVPDGPWRRLVGQAAGAPAVRPGEERAAAEAVAEVLRELGPGHRPFEVVLDTSGLDSTGPDSTGLDSTGSAGTGPDRTVGAPAAEEVLRVSFERSGGALRLRLTHRTSAVGAEYAQRLAGYYARALAALADDPSADHRSVRLLSEAETALQLDGLAGERRELPDRRFHQLFEERVRLHPDRVAVVHLDRTLTYGELNARANRVARALLARGLRPEEVVAVVTERDLDWLVAVLAVLKSGGAYLPLEPHFPAERIGSVLAGSGARTVLTERGSTANLLPALAALGLPAPLTVAELYAEEHASTDPETAVGPASLAYVYFTSGSTGAPKGAMCEQEGMLNHLYAKIEDLGITEGQVVAQTAPQCFDISLWQLLAALLVGGRTLIVEQEAVLDVPRYLDRLVSGDVEVLQVVPSYLELVLSQLELAPRPLGRLRIVSATGEALKKELVTRWFAAYPQIALANAYGLTETSDDTNHEVMRAVPPQDAVPLGRPVRNVRVYVVDERLELVPLGSPGEIVFSGVCVGRGYINDPERTRLAFLPDPYRPGQRLYRSGDFGRWLPGGTLGFAGRRDAQVKIRGFRIEIGEIENRMLGIGGVADAAVVVVDAPSGEKRLVGFYAARPATTAGQVRETLAGQLPEYMVPALCHRLDALPLTDNGKTDRKALTRLVDELAPADGESTEPATPTERRLAGAWAEALKIPVGQIRREHDFYGLGGSSLSAVRMVIANDRWFSLQDLVTTPVLAALAALLDGRTTAPADSSAPLPAPTALAVTRADRRPPVVLADAVEPGGAARWVAEHTEALRAVIAADGAVLVRGLGLTEAAQVTAVARALGAAPVVEREGFAPRQVLAEGTYGSSEWPPDQPMCMHHELSYADEFPSLMLFGCLRAPAEGGATAVADSREVLAALPAELVAKFEREGWTLARTYNGLVGVGWQEAFGARTREEVDAYCRDHGITARWEADGTLRTSQHRPAVLHHPITGERGWFNQIAFLNEWTLDPAVREFLTLEFGEDGLPFNSLDGNGERIDPAVVRSINAVYDSLTQREPWRDGDLLIVDNLRMAHSREPFEGPRQVVVAMAGPVRLADCRPRTA
ncbi:amino acid adenylation domain-containing protein [Kitasatospora sp. NPDC096147]|uniref:non-ribosomal peptide synthetase n=1 Tax=Kitasatospora sp. NPDC096147 TaxID=3364093 RepID=UPI00382C50F5